MTAPVMTIIGMDMEFHQKLPHPFPRNLEARSWFVSKPEKIQETAFRSSLSQGVYFIQAARSLGLDRGPMPGFNEQNLEAEFFSDGKMKSNFICAIDMWITPVPARVAQD